MPMWEMRTKVEHYNCNDFDYDVDDLDAVVRTDRRHCSSHAETEVNISNYYIIDFFFFYRLIVLRSSRHGEKKE